MRHMLLCVLLACGASRTERVSIDPTPLPTSPQPTTSGELSRPEPEVAGTYALDAAASRPYLEARFAKLPPEEQEFVKMAIAMLDKLNAELTITADGRASMTARIDEGDGGTERSRTGTWRRDGEELVLTTEGKDMRCKPDKNARLLCVEHGDTFVFTRRAH